MLEGGLEEGTTPFFFVKLELSESLQALFITKLFILRDMIVLICRGLYLHNAISTITSDKIFYKHV
jgi:hypothetical protein